MLNLNVQVSLKHTHAQTPIQRPSLPFLPPPPPPTHTHTCPQFSPLHMAALHGRDSVVAALLDMGMRTDIPGPVGCQVELGYHHTKCLLFVVAHILHQIHYYNL